MNLIDLADKTIGRLQVIERSGNIGKHPAWKCLCICGNETIVRGDHLRRELIRSCGCLEEENRGKGANLKHGGSDTRLYSIWSGMLKRCNNSNCRAYSNYGGRGITVCKEWTCFSAFREWAFNNGYSNSLSIDRINNNGNYEPQNCRWTTSKEQANNRRKRRIPNEINPSEYKGA